MNLGCHPGFITTHPSLAPALSAKIPKKLGITWEEFASLVMTRMPGKPFQSKLEPFYEFIREGRSKRWSYQKIADVLTHEKGLPVSANAVFSFVKVRAKRRRLYTLPPLETPPSFPAATTKAREFFTSPSTKEPHETKQRPYNI